MEKEPSVRITTIHRLDRHVHNCKLVAFSCVCFAERRAFVFNGSWLAHIFAFCCCCRRFFLVILKNWFSIFGVWQITLEINVFHQRNRQRFGKMFCSVFFFCSVCKYMPLVGYVFMFMFMFINTKTICHFVSFFSRVCVCFSWVRLWTVPVARWFWQALIFIADNIYTYSKSAKVSAMSTSNQKKRESRYFQRQ